MGEKIGQLRSASETTQLAIIFGSIGLWGLLWAIGLVGPILTLVCLFLTILGFYSLTLLLGSKLEVFEEGFSIPDDDKAYPIGYDELKSISAKRTDHTMRGTYVGTRAEFTFGREHGKPWFRYDCEYRRGDAKEMLLEELIRRCSTAIQAKLLNEMNERGVVDWSDEVSMSPQGFLLQRPGADRPLVVPFDQVEDVQIRDNVLQIWKQGDAIVPFCTVQNDVRNFIPLYDLFCNFCRTARKLSEMPECNRAAAHDQVAGVVEHAV